MALARTNVRVSEGDSREPQGSRVLQLLDEKDRGVGSKKRAEAPDLQGVARPGDGRRARAAAGMVAVRRSDRGGGPHHGGGRPPQGPTAASRKRASWW